MKNINPLIKTFAIGAIGVAALWGCQKEPSGSPEAYLNRNLSVPYRGERMAMYDNDGDGHIDWIVGTGLEFTQESVPLRLESHLLSDSTQYWADQVNHAQAHLIYWLGRDRTQQK